MADSTVRIRGLKETVSAFKKLDRNLPKVVTDGLKDAAVPVADASRQKISRYGGAKLNTIRPRVAGRGSVFVTQGARKVTGLRGDFGSLQMRRMLEALDENEGEVIRRVEHALEAMTRTF